MALAKRHKEDASDWLRAVIEEALESKGVSARQASLDVVGHDGLIRDIRAGRLPSIDKLQALSEYFGLELYIGPPISREAIEDAKKRASVFSDAERLAAAISAVEEGLSQSRRKMKPAKKAEVILLAYELLGDVEDGAEEKIIRLIKAV
ncbi:hypothetical protein GTA62_12910 [Roseobacter sp. HKCCD9010]|uniref:hypothetical protein n=1 Tax=unclassified Roseobacter TaxID=196798 RepID=UPI0014914362|nr:MULTISPECIES: hypothetical protein [unclassified Roseobacter]MBF9049916.1 hypothetical protein [Rhodobacterales bacterium HKCCD4356]NNV13545.1 hypothetical protein [Roseobacter sp. HKCCD7357]NNV16378.1 hypothetical protein [Roseobacter sp. HKCCD8768]NNV25838.1 hypothetical protein [Roseobacter sp. HKCCD8192]NNV30094.1 hypothetical protein [Roseobacter sp. HKCCD9061]